LMGLAYNIERYFPSACQSLCPCIYVCGCTFKMQKIP